MIRLPDKRRTEAEQRRGCAMHPPAKARKT
nr:MAG TPA: hypothetical protein [Caudoviricetes sp.]